MNVLVTGASGFVGRRLIKALIENGYHVRALVRSALQVDYFDANVDAVRGDAQDIHALKIAMTGMDYAYFLIHSLGSAEGSYTEKDILLAKNFLAAAREMKIKKIIYLSGLFDAEKSKSKHIHSREEVGAILGSSEIPCIELRAGMIIGPGSLSFELLRYLSERVPVILSPKWIFQKTNPIAIDDIIHYLINSISIPCTSHRVIEVGTLETLTYGEILKIYCELRGLKRLILSLPFLTIKISSLWIGLISPLKRKALGPLLEGISDPLLVKNRCTDKELSFAPKTVRKAIIDTLSDLRPQPFAPECRASGNERKTTHKMGMIIDSYSWIVHQSPSETFEFLSQIGGKNGWPYATFLWKLRGLLDRMIGGVGMRSDHLRDTPLRPNSIFDFWRVEEIENERKILLKAEMKVPGDAWLEFHISPYHSHKTQLVQTAYFAPRGLRGVIYWYALYPIHRIIFSGMLRAIAKETEKKRVQKNLETLLKTKHV